MEFSNSVSILSSPPAEHNHNDSHDDRESSATILGIQASFPWSIKDTHKFAATSPSDDDSILLMAESDIDSADSGGNHGTSTTPATTRLQQHPLPKPLSSATTDGSPNVLEGKRQQPKQQQQQYYSGDETRIEKLKGGPTVTALSWNRSIGYSSSGDDTISTNLSRETSTSGDEQIFLEDMVRTKKKKSRRHHTRGSSLMAKKDKKKKSKKTGRKRSGSTSEREMDDELQKMRTKIQEVQHSQSELRGSLGSSGSTTSGNIHSQVSAAVGSFANSTTSTHESSLNSSPRPAHNGPSIFGPTSEPFDRTNQRSSVPPSRDNSCSPNQLIAAPSSPLPTGRGLSKTPPPLIDLTKSELDLLQEATGEERLLSPTPSRGRKKSTSPKRRKPKAPRSTSPSRLSSLSKSERDLVAEIDRTYGVEDQETKREKKPKQARRSSVAKSKKEYLENDSTLALLDAADDIRKVDTKKTDRNNASKQSRRAGSPGLQVRRAERSSMDLVDVGFASAVKVVRDMNLDSNLADSPHGNSTGVISYPTMASSLKPSATSWGSHIFEATSSRKQRVDIESLFAATNPASQFPISTLEDQTEDTASRLSNKSRSKEQQHKSQSSGKLAAPKKSQSILRNFSLSPISRTRDAVGDRAQYLVGDMTENEMKGKLHGVLHLPSISSANLAESGDPALPTPLGRATSVPLTFPETSPAQRLGPKSGPNEKMSGLTEEELEMLQEAERTSKLGTKSSRRHRQKRRSIGKSRHKEPEKTSLLADDDDEEGKQTHERVMPFESISYKEQKSVDRTWNRPTDADLSHENKTAGSPGLGNTLNSNTGAQENLIDQNTVRDLHSHDKSQEEDRDESAFPPATERPSRVVSMPMTEGGLESVMKKKSKQTKPNGPRRASSLPPVEGQGGRKGNTSGMNGLENEAGKVSLKNQNGGKHVPTQASSLQISEPEGEVKGFAKAPTRKGAKRHQSLQFVRNTPASEDKLGKSPNPTFPVQRHRSVEVPSRRGRSLERVSSDEDGGMPETRMARRSTWDAASVTSFASAGLDTDSEEGTGEDKDKFQRPRSKSPRVQSRFAMFLGNPFNGGSVQADASPPTKGVSFALRLSPFWSKAKNKDNPLALGDATLSTGTLPDQSVIDHSMVTNQNAISCMQLMATGDAATLQFVDVSKSLHINPQSEGLDNVAQQSAKHN